MLARLFVVSLLALALCGALILSVSAAERASAGSDRRADTSGDGLVSAGEYTTEALRRFGRLDGNGDGFVDEAEVDKAAGEIMLRIKGRMAAQLRRGDANGDGRLSRDEAERAAASRFAALDRDGDGSLRPSDFRRSVKTAGSEPPASDEGAMDPVAAGTSVPKSAP